ncbi:MAG: SseB family protein [Proteobacteria bacterium]|nr:SseB family protein [Pseudomonadota bacterium]MBS0572578.1 SseB family protein [Pseudomonadota bacterium]
MTDTPLDAAHAAMTAAPDDDAARLHYYQSLAATELCLLLAREPSDDLLDPQVLETGDGPLILAFDGEERLAASSDRPLPYAALPGRAILALMAGRGLSLGVNLGGSGAAFLMPPATVDWLAARLAEAPVARPGAPSGWSAPEGGAPLARHLARALAGAGALAARAWLVTAHRAGGDGSPALVIEDAGAGTETVLAKAAAEALALSGHAEGRADVLFLTGAEIAASGLLPHALAVPLSRPAPPADPMPAAPAAPGSDPDRPPHLR